MRARLAIQSLAILLLFSSLARSQERPKGLSEREASAVDEVVRAEMERQGVLGLAVGVVREGEIVYLKGYGLEDREAGTPVTEQTRFRWASISKPVTAIAALQLAEQGKLDLDADVRTYVPEFPDKGATITCRQLLGHLGGVVHYGGGVVPRKREYDEEHPFADPVKAIDTFAESRLVCKPGERFSYSTHGFILLSAAVQRAGDRPFAEQVRQRICKPLGMETLQADCHEQTIPHRAVGYIKHGETLDRSGDTDTCWKLGGGGFLSTVGDLARFARGLIDHRLVSAETEEVMWTSLHDASGRPTHYGLGFAVGRDRFGRPMVWHDGAQEKARCRMVLYPNDRFGIVVMSNCEFARPIRFSQAINRIVHAVDAK